jgi:hypothetical protein
VPYSSPTQNEKPSWIVAGRGRDVGVVHCAPIVSDFTGVSFPFIVMRGGGGGTSLLNLLLGLKVKVGVCICWCLG